MKISKLLNRSVFGCVCIAVSSLAVADQVLSVVGHNYIWSNSATEVVIAPSSGGPNITCTFSGNDLSRGDLFGAIALIAMKYHNALDSVGFDCNSLSIRRGINEIYVSREGGQTTAWHSINGQNCLTGDTYGQSANIALAIANDWPMTLQCNYQPWINLWTYTLHVEFL